MGVGNGVTLVFGEVQYKGGAARLTPFQFRIMEMLIAARPDGIPTIEIYERIYADRETTKSDAVTVRNHIMEIRKKLSKGKVPIEIENRYEFGYRAVLR